jgi:hypothetical protein
MFRLAMESLAPLRVPASSVAHGDIARQHHALQVEVGELRAMIDSLPATQRTDRYCFMLAVLVCRLGERLKTHFEHEAESGYLATADALAPEQSSEASRLHAEHAELVCDAARLADALRAPAAPPDAVARILRWLDVLRHHERAEHDLVERALAAPR